MTQMLTRYRNCRPCQTTLLALLLIGADFFLGWIYGKFVQGGLYSTQFYSLGFMFYPFVMFMIDAAYMYLYRKLDINPLIKLCTMTAILFMMILHVAAFRAQFYTWFDVEYIARYNAQVAELLIVCLVLSTLSWWRGDGGFSIFCRGSWLDYVVNSAGSRYYSRISA